MNMEPRVNQFPGRCVACGAPVRSGGGLLRGQMSHTPGPGKLIRVDGTLFSVPTRLAPLLEAAPELLAALKVEHRLPGEEGCVPRVCQSCQVIAHAEGRG